MSGWYGTLLLSASTSLQVVALDRLAPTNVSSGREGASGGYSTFKLSTWRQHTSLQPGHRHMVTAGEMEIKFLAGEPRSP